MNGYSVLMLISGTIIIGYLGYLTFERTKISEYVWLLLTGLLVGPVFNLIDPTLFLTAAPLFTVGSLLLIAFDAGMELDVWHIIPNVPRAALLAISGLLLTVGGSVLFSFFVPILDLMAAILLGLILGVCSTAVMLPLLERLKLRKDVKAILTLETVVIDPLILALTIFLIRLVILPGPVHLSASQVGKLYLFGLAGGLLTGVGWLFVFERLRERPFGYLLTVAMILILYLSTEAVGGDGIIATLIFGLVLGNSRTFFKIFGRERQFSLTGSLREFHDEILFLIRSFFFLFMGLMIDIDVTFIGWGVLLFSLLALARVLAVRVATLGMALSGAELGAMSVMMPRGLFTTLLASTALTYEIPHAPTLLNLSFVVILLTILYATLGTRAFAQIRWAR